MLRQFAVFCAASLAMSGAAIAETPFLGEIKTFGMSFCPRGWAPANGQILQINQNQGLFSLLSTNFGGNGQTNFALPDFRGRVLVGTGQGPGLSPYAVGQSGGTESVTLTTAQLPVHSHNVADLGAPPAVRVKRAQGALASARETTAGGTIASQNAGGGQAHSNLQPYTTMTTCIALTGSFPQPPP